MLDSGINMKTKSLVLKLLGAILLTPILVVVAYVIYIYFYSIDEIVTHGSAHGFTIGQSKKETLEIAKELYKDQNTEFRYSHPFSEQAKSLIVIPLAKTELKDIVSFETWKFRFDSDLVDYVELTFKEGVVFEIIRWRNEGL